MSYLPRERVFKFHLDFVRCLVKPKCKQPDEGERQEQQLYICQEGRNSDGVILTWRRGQRLVI